MKIKQSYAYNPTRFAVQLMREFYYDVTPTLANNYKKSQVSAEEMRVLIHSLTTYLDTLYRVCCARPSGLLQNLELFADIAFLLYAEKSNSAILNELNTFLADLFSVEIGQLGADGAALFEQAVSLRRLYDEGKNTLFPLFKENKKHAKISLRVFHDLIKTHVERDIGTPIYALCYPDPTEKFLSDTQKQASAFVSEHTKHTFFPRAQKRQHPLPAIQEDVENNINVALIFGEKINVKL